MYLGREVFLVVPLALSSAMSYGVLLLVFYV